MPTPPVRVGVVFGGDSGEHDVSIRSAATVIKALSDPGNRQRFHVVPLYIDREGRWWPETIASSVLQKMAALVDDQLPQPLPARGLRQLPVDPDQIDVWYPVLHGPNGEDGTVQGLFTLMRKPFVGSGVLGSAVGMDKLAMKAAFAAAGISSVELNGKRLLAGQQAGGIEVVEILIDSVILRAGGRDFRLRALNTWVNL